ncbi:MAG TPA: PQQ-binding-like beta-propeller repeat protein [Caulobacteraceae bacterium]|nr:PQQ-binding-like beta-propeller repeat protein [Caulobacteraceae bacterium]
MSEISRRQILASSTALALMGPLRAAAQNAPAPAPMPARAPSPHNTNWMSYGNDLGSTHYAPLDQIDAGNFNSLEVAWRFNTDAFGAHLDAYYNCTPLIVNGRLYATAGNERYLVSLDGETGQLLWSYRHDEKGRQGSRGGSGWGVSYWTDGQVERVLYVTRSYQLISVDAKTGLPDPNFGVAGEVDLRLDDDQDIDPKKGVLGLHAAPTVIGNTVVVGCAPTAAVKGYVRGYDARTGKRKWIFHTVPRKGEFGYDTWLKPEQTETIGNMGAWAPMSADPELGLVYVGVELPATDDIGTGRWGNSLFSETMVALDAETGERRWHYQTEHHGMWDRDICAAAILFDLPKDGKVIKALAIPSKQAYLFVLDRTTGKPIWPIPERPVPKGDVPGEWYSPTQPMPSKPPPFDRQGFSEDSLVDFTPEVKARAIEVASHYKTGPLYTPPAFIKPEGPWGTLVLPGTQGGANWPGGSYDPDTGMLYLYSKTAVESLGVIQGADGKLAQKGGRAPANTNDDNGGAFGGTASLHGGTSGLGGAPNSPVKDGLNDPIQPGVLTIAGIPLNKPPYGRISAINLRTGEIAWQVVHGETPDFIKNHPLLKGVTIPRTGQSGILGSVATKTLLVCGDAGLFTDAQGRKGARLRAYDKATGQEVGAVFMEKNQTGTPITYMLGGQQYIVLAVGGMYGADLVAYRLPSASERRAAAAARGATISDN